MRLCPKCRTELEPGFDVCWACGASRHGDPTPRFNPEFEGIIGADEYAAETEAKRQENLVTVATFWSAPEAHLLRSRLEAAGVTAIVTDELSSAWGLAHNLGSVKVQVPEVEVPKAFEVLESLGQSASQDDRLIAKAVVEGIQTEPSPPAQPPDKDVSAMRQPLPKSLMLGFPCILIWPVLLILLILMIVYINWLM